MQSDENNMDDFFRSKYDEFEADGTDKAMDWQQMIHLLDKKPKGVNKQQIRKTVSRRVITYLGLTAVITSVVYFSITHKPPVKRKGTATKESVKTNNNQVAENNIPSVNKSFGAVTALKNSNTITSKRLNKRVVTLHQKTTDRRTIIKEVTDTVFQNLPPVNSNVNSSAVIRDFYDRIRPPAQYFTVDPKRDTILFGKNGTVISIPAYSFSDNKNKIVKSRIKFELTECYNYPDMLSYDLTTTAGKEQLVTAGMLRIGANADGEELKLFAYRSLGVKMPIEQYDPEMQLFTLVPQQGRAIFDYPANGSGVMESRENREYSDAGTGADWQPAGQQQAYKNLASYLERKTIKLFDLRQIMKSENEKYNAHFLIKGNDNISDDKIKQLIQNKYLNQFDKLTIERVKNFPEEMIAKNTNVMVTKIGFVAADSVEINFRQAVSEKLVSVGDSLSFVQQLNQEKQRFIEKIRSDSVAYVRQKRFDKTYNFDITGLGWINCDKIYRSNQPAIEFSINIGNDIDQVRGNYKLVFTNIRSVLPGKFENGKVSFGNVPVNEPVQVVCVAQKNGKAVACIRSMRVTGDAVGALQFEEMTPAVFKERIAAL